MVVDMELPCSMLPFLRQLFRAVVARSMVLVVMVTLKPADGSEVKWSVKQKESYRVWLNCGSLEAINIYWQAKQYAAQAVAEPKTWHQRNSSKPSGSSGKESHALSTLSTVRVETCLPPLRF